MIKDARLRLVFIPVLGISLPLLSGIVTYSLYTVIELLAANLLFIFTSLIIWAGCNWIHGRIRPLFSPLANPFSKIFTVCSVSALYGGSIGTLSVATWLVLSRESFSWKAPGLFVILCMVAVIVFTLIYEILFLSKERELDTKIVTLLDKERTQAELQALTNELDPHFIFNALNTLNHLIVNNPEQAYLFNNRLAQVYRYFLVNRVKELISLEEELEFINNYFFLLQIRHDHKLQLVTETGDNPGLVMIPPCALQILIENAIKHNEFTDIKPLRVNIIMNGHFLKVINNTRPKPYAVNSTGIGLKNLSSRYKIICRKDIVIERSREQFTVKLPLIK